jgi:two-component system C4-dicarboxylate transport response regulator DctD
MILKKQGFTLDTHSDPIAALSHFKPDYLAVLDYLMPGLNGLELYKRLKDKDPSVKALILTASHEEMNELQKERQEPLNFVGKPVAAELLLKQINSTLNDVTVETDPDIKL